MVKIREEYRFEYYNENYPFLNVPQPIGVEHYEVTDYSMEVIFEKYPLYQQKQPDYEFTTYRRNRRQMSTAGAYLKNKNDGIDIVADIMTSQEFKPETTSQQEEAFEIFKCIYRTIGNILPVCEGINAPWGGNPKTQDNSWRKLTLLKEHFEEMDYNDADILKTINYVEKKLEMENCLATGVILQILDA